MQTSATSSKFGGSGKIPPPLSGCWFGMSRKIFISFGSQFSGGKEKINEVQDFDRRFSRQKNWTSILNHRSDITSSVGAIKSHQSSLGRRLGSIICGGTSLQLGHQLAMNQYHSSWIPNTIIRHRHLNNTARLSIDYRWDISIAYQRSAARSIQHLWTLASALGHQLAMNQYHSSWIPCIIMWNKPLIIIAELSIGCATFGCRIASYHHRAVIKNHHRSAQLSIGVNKSSLGSITLLLLHQIISQRTLAVQHSAFVASSPYYHARPSRLAIERNSSFGSNILLGVINIAS